MALLFVLALSGQTAQMSPIQVDGFSIPHIVLRHFDLTSTPYTEGFARKVEDRRQTYPDGRLFLDQLLALASIDGACPHITARNLSRIKRRSPNLGISRRRPSTTCRTESVFAHQQVPPTIRLSLQLLCAGSYIPSAQHL